MGQVTEKGQVTIPIELRRKFGLLPHTEVEVVEKDGDVVVRAKEGGVSRGRWIAEQLRGSATNRALTTEQLMAMTRGED
ncbi:AbrB/MazE/SpoVT family DNA-binding domain-containing protein [Candidatus Amarobacter glycogenicus]|jgi:AbrB family looped-hinge helix DNA binding protein|uniref:AbrB/MazE/SpoVT family DNA-binding domain-containing protein n=1 Tax=Candidatus Amarobacter glycogenicus TaxID=3140699 RepID=UPI002A1127E7|nr:AbrB/MazE/SpoVT family DNA-binding domain-containing protein [Dehalococcoidia bacterium]MBK9547453.1 AbrB/MazE/SpoVT family DNA-binding domain-containing protein [Dehalococcoidia bacterium]MBK9612154.1 AbrB/MazE/SpoVT family DNA-binding domain-containing protein [Dehalococcoidia bacterium]MCC6268154.1 AbrB/MazE/SpoVT family DNA-binding domain-containing protein [Dehalococcoidia bacterium]